MRGSDRNDILTLDEAAGVLPRPDVPEDDLALQSAKERDPITEEHGNARNDEALALHHSPEWGGRERASAQHENGFLNPSRLAAIKTDAFIAVLMLLARSQQGGVTSSTPGELQVGDFRCG
jgi:hypothetical protein